MNRFPVTRRFGRHSLAPGTYRIVAVTEHGGTRRRLGRTSVQVSPSGRIRRAAMPVLHCSQSLPASAVPSLPKPVPPSANGAKKTRPHHTSFLPPRVDVPKLPLPGLSLGRDADGWLTVLQIALLAAIVAITGVVLGYVVRFYRRIANP
jgi:hypothetical protein